MGMDIRYFVSLIEANMDTPEPKEIKAPVLEETACDAWIDAEGALHRSPRSGLTEGCIRLVHAGDEFGAEWESDEPSQAAFRTLSRIIQESDHEVYSLNAMMFPTRRQAIAAANSLAR